METIMKSKVSFKTEYTKVDSDRHTFKSSWKMAFEIKLVWCKTFLNPCHLFIICIFCQYFGDSYSQLEHRKKFEL